MNNSSLMPSTQTGSFYKAKDLHDALSALQERGATGEAFAGGTWLMRAAVRGELLNRAYVSIATLDELQQVVITDKQIEIGAAVTHRTLAAHLKGIAIFRGLFDAASKAANTSIRNVATVGGNICSTRFHASDLLPALLCMEAKVELRCGNRRELIPISEFLVVRNSIVSGTLVTKIVVPIQSLLPYRTSHVRLPLRKAGDYPVAIVSMALALTRENRIQSARIAHGSVETVARRWIELESSIIGYQIDAPELKRLANDACTHLVGRDGVEAPGWYRIRVLPALVQRAIAAAEA